VTVWHHSTWIEDALAVLTWNALHAGLDIPDWWAVEEAIGDLEALIPAGVMHLPVEPRPGSLAKVHQILARPPADAGVGELIAAGTAAGRLHRHRQR
jgi:hypothetical protein